MKLFSKSAFTLAEVLITLGIIGMVAQMTLPALMQSTDKQANLSRLKKFYASFNQGMQMYMQSEDCPDLACTNIFLGKHDSAEWQSAVLSALKISFKNVVPCVGSECKVIIKYLGGGSPFSLFEYPTYYTVKMSDGSLVAFRDADSQNCYVSETGKIKGICSFVYVEVNGAKFPNTRGRDFFIFILAADGVLYPYKGAEYAKWYEGSDDIEASSAYWQTDTGDCGTAGSDVLPANTEGGSCAARIMESGWIMDY